MRITEKVLLDMEKLFHQAGVNLHLSFQNGFVYVQERINTGECAGSATRNLFSGTAREAHAFMQGYPIPDPKPTVPEQTLRKIIDLILYRRQTTPWDVLGAQFAQDLKAIVQGDGPGHIDVEAETRCGIAAELWKLYGSGKPYVDDVDKAVRGLFGGKAEKGR